MAWRHTATATERNSTDGMKRFLRSQPQGPSGPLSDDLTQYGCEEFTPPPPEPPTVERVARRKLLEVREETEEAHRNATDETADEKLQRALLSLGWITKQLKALGNPIYTGAPAAVQGLFDRNEGDFDSAVPYYEAYKTVEEEVRGIVADGGLTDDEKRAQIDAVTWSLT